MKKKLIVRIILIVLISALVGFGAVTYSKSVTGDRGGLPFGFGIFVVTSGSMEPTLNVGDLIFVVKDDKYEPQEIVVFNDGSSNVVHRIVRVNGDEVVTKGDYEGNSEDDPIQMSDIKGELLFHIPFVGYVLNFVRTPAVTVALIALCAYLYILSIKKETQDKKDEEEKLKEEIEKLKQELDK